MKYTEDFSKVKVSEGAWMVGGGLILGLGVIIPPFATSVSIVL